MLLIKKYLAAPQYLILFLILLLTFTVNAQDSKFTVVIDAGHGGHDSGAKGSFLLEKDVNLAVSLDLGSLIERNFKDVRVIFTRKTDKFLPLPDRADVANNNHADLFICIHSNASPSSAAYGAETYTLGLAKTKANLDVAMRENSVILLEEDYKTKYKGFDPNSVDSYIMFELMQDKYIDRSLEFSTVVQKQFVNYCRRSDRGVRQAGFWVLHRSACPSVLVELGFVSNPAEERYLSSETGQKEMATAIYNAFVEYKRAHDKKTVRQNSANSYKEPKQIEPQTPVVIVDPIPTVSVSEKNPQENNSKQPITDSSRKTIIDSLKKTAIDTLSKASKKKQSKVLSEKIVSTQSMPVVTTIDENSLKQMPVYKVQLFASKKPVKPNAPDFKGVKNIDSFVENGYNKYTVGAETDYQKIESIRKQVLAKFPEAFIIAFMGDKKINAKEALNNKK